MVTSGYKFCCLPLLVLLSCGSMIAPPSSVGSSGVLKQETLVWSDEFSGATVPSAPNSQNWTYDSGPARWNKELETYCAYGSSTAPCDAKNPNAYVGTDGYLHIVARSPSNGVNTSARLKSEGL